MSNEIKESTYQPFIVEDLATATEAQRRYKYFAEKIKENDIILEKEIEPLSLEIERLKEKNHELNKEYLDKQDHYITLLEGFIRSGVQKDVEAGKKPTKTVKTLHGAIQLRKQQPEFNRDADMLFDFAKESGYTKTTIATDWATLKKDSKVVNGHMVTKDGEIVKGVEVVEREDKFGMNLE